MTRAVLVIFLIATLCGAVKLMTEDEKQNAFQQLLSKSGKLRLGGREVIVPTAAPLETTTDRGITIGDEENKKHDRRHATVKAEANKTSVKKERKRHHHHPG